MFAKVQWDDEVKTFDEITEWYPNNFILVKRTSEDSGTIVGLSTGSEVILADYATVIYEELNPQPKKNPCIILYGNNIDSSIGGVFLED